MLLLRKLALLASSFLSITSANPCDSDWGNLCPESDLSTVGDCLKAVSSKLSPSCTTFIALQDACAEDIRSGKCPAFEGDTTACLTEWNKPEDMSPECVAAWPVKEVKKEKVKKERTGVDKLKADRKKATRERAAQMARDQHPQNPKNVKKKKEL